MENKTQQNDKKNLSHVFEVHTMKKDAASIIAEKKAPSPTNKEGLSIAKEKAIVKDMPVANPFLDAKETQLGSDVFHKEIKTVQTERVNQVPSDIAKNAPLPLKSAVPQKKHANTLHVVMIIFVTVFLIGAVIFGVYFFMEQRKKDVQEDVLQEDILPVDDEAIVDVDDAEVYSTDLPNYFSFDVESETSKSDIAREIDLISTNLRQSDIVEPISFIVTDQKDNPVSFHVFAISSGLAIPQEVMESLEEDFEIYAYNDTMKGVRFGFVVDIKAVNLLQDTLKVKEPELSAGMGILLKNAPSSATPQIFKDSMYNGQAIRYANLDESEAYSIDYALVGQRLVVGTSKDTLRAILDDLKKETLAPEDPAGFTYE